MADEESTPLPITTEEDGSAKAWTDGTIEVIPGGWAVVIDGKTVATGSKTDMVAQARAEGDERKLDTLVLNADGTKGRKYYHS